MPELDMLRLLGSALCLVCAVVLQAAGLMSGAYDLPLRDPARRRAVVPPVVLSVVGTVLFPWGTLD